MKFPARTGLPDSVATEYADGGSHQICARFRSSERRLHFSRREDSDPEVILWVPAVK